MKFQKINLLTLFAMCIVFYGQAQDDLINKIKNNKSDSKDPKFIFTKVYDSECTDVKDQASSSTCWSYSTLSFLESEVLRTKKKTVDISEMFVVRNQYIDKAELYVRLHGGLLFGPGGSAHDNLVVLEKYGMIPQEAYTGLQYGTSRNNLGELERLMTAMLGTLVKDDVKKLTPVWKKAFTRVVDTYLGDVPTSFVYEGKSYTPRSFADEVLGLNPKDYMEFTNYTTAPYWTKTPLMVPDNWDYGTVWNVPMNDLTNIIDNAIAKGYTVAWSADVSEKGFSWVNGVAYIPAKPFETMTAEEKASIFDGPKPERSVSEQLRQQEFDNYQTTDDHGMQITGLYKDQDGREYYKVKNSWGASNDYQGYLYVTKNYVRMKTTSMMVHKDGVPKDIRSKCNI